MQFLLNLFYPLQEEVVVEATESRELKSQDVFSVLAIASIAKEKAANGLVGRKDKTRFHPIKRYHYEKESSD